MRTQRLGARSKPAVLLGVLGILVVAAFQSQAEPPADGSRSSGRSDASLRVEGDASTSEEAPVAGVPTEDARTAAIRSLGSGELDVSIDPASLFDVQLGDEAAVALEKARLAAIVSAAESVPAPEGADAVAWRARIDLDRARLAFLGLDRERRAAILQADSVRKERAASRESEDARRKRDAEAERNRLLEAARIARTEAERLVAEEEARLVALETAVEDVVARFESDRAALADLRDVVFGWQRRVRDAKGRSAEDADETYDDLRRALRTSRDALAAALEAVGSDSSDVPLLGEDPLRDVPPDVPIEHVRSRRLDLAARIGDARREERTLRNARTEALHQEITLLNQERLDLLPHLSTEKRSSIVGFTAAGFDQARAELRHLSLIFRYHDHALRHLLGGLRSGAPSAAVAWETASVLVPFVLFAALFLSVRRRTPGLVSSLGARLEALDRRARRTFPSPQTRAVRVLARIHRPIEWIVFFAGSVWLLPDSAFDLLEVQVLSSIAGWVLGGRLVVISINAVAGVTGTTALYEDAAIARLRLRSLQLVGRTIVAFVLILLLSDRLVGEGTIYHWALSMLGFAIVPVFLVLVRWWRGTIFVRLDRTRRKSKLETWILANRSGWKSFLAAMLGAVHLFSTGAIKLVRRWLSGFEIARRIHAYLFQLEIERRGESDSRRKLFPLATETLGSLHPDRPSDRLLPCPADRLLDDLIRRIESGRGGVVALVAARGMGKSSVLRALSERAPDAVTLDCRSDTTLGDIEEAFAACGFEGAGESPALEGETVPRVVLLDDVHALVRLAIDGLRRFDELSTYARSRCGRVLWVFAIDSSVWPFLERSRDATPIFDEVRWLEPWDEQQIGVLLHARCEAAGISPIFDDLVERLPFGADERDRSDALQAKRTGYERMLWDHAGGNPGIALEVWRSSLARDEGEVVRVRSLQVPDADLLETLPDATLFVLRAVIQATSATVDDVARVTRLERVEVLDMVRFGEAKGYFSERDGRIRVEWSWLRPVMRILERRRLLVAR